MQPGLNIGIGSWIDAQYGNPALPAFPALPIPFELRHPTSLVTPDDLARTAELALLANRLGSPDSVYDTSGIPVYLWERHQSNIRQMVTAASTLSAEQQDELSRVDSLLYKSDGFTLSDTYALYIETREIYQELVAQGAGAQEVELAYTNWLTLGHKALIEEAIASKLGLTRTTSRVVAQNDVSKIEMALTSMGGDVPHAPTTFAPLSAISTAHWTEAEVDFQALEDAIRPQVSRTSWTRFRANKNGKVRFRFICVELIRPWFTAVLYEADDWRLASGPDALVASGDGRSGTLPSYFSQLYMAQILDIRHQNGAANRPQKPTLVLRPDRPLQNITTSARAGVFTTGPASAIQVTRSHPLATFRPKNAAGRPAGTARTPGGDRATRGTKTPINRTRAGSTVRLSGITASTVAPVRPGVTTVSLSRIESRPHYQLGSAGRIAIIQKLDRLSALNRLNFVQAHLVATSPPGPAPPADTTTYLVGFGRTNLPRCPDPNPNYQWP